MRRIIMTTALSLCLGLTAASGAPAQTLTMGTTAPGTLIYSTGAAVAKVLAEHGVQVRLQPMAGAQAFAPLLGTDEVHIGMLNIDNLVQAYNGKPPFKQANPNARLLTVLHPFSVGLIVRKDSPIKSIADVKGKRVVGGYNQMPYIATVVRAMLATANLTYDDVEVVPVPIINRGLEDFDQNKVDVTYHAVGAARANESDVNVGGIRYLPIETSPDALERMRKVLSVTYSRTLPAGYAPGINAPTPAMTYDQVLAVGANMPEATVQKILQILHDNKAALAAGYLVLKDFEPKQMWKSYPIPYHPAAVKFFESKGYKPVKP